MFSYPSGNECVGVHGFVCISCWIAFKLNLCMVVFLFLILPMLVLFWPSGCMFSCCAFVLLIKGINALGRGRLVAVVFWNFATVELVLYMWK